MNVTIAKSKKIKVENRKSHYNYCNGNRGDCSCNSFNKINVKPGIQITEPYIKGPYSYILTCDNEMYFSLEIDQLIRMGVEFADLTISIDEGMINGETTSGMTFSSKIHVVEYS